MSLIEVAPVSATAAAIACATSAWLSWLGKKPWMIAISSLSCVARSARPAFSLNLLQFLPALRHLLEERQYIFIGHGFSLPSRLDLLVLERGHDHPDRADAALFAGLHRRLKLA